MQRADGVRTSLRPTNPCHVRLRRKFPTRTAGTIAQESARRVQQQTIKETSRMRRMPLDLPLVGLMVVDLLLATANIGAQPADSVGRVTAIEGRATILRQ